MKYLFIALLITGCSSAVSQKEAKDCFYYESRREENLVLALQTDKPSDDIARSICSQKWVQECYAKGKCP